MPATTSVQIYGNYDKAFVSWVHSLQHHDRPLLCVFATPERAFCLAGDTEVPLLDGRTLTMKQIAIEFKEQSFWVYSTTADGRLAPGKAHSARKTGTKVSCVKVRLDNGKVVRCTADHLFMLRDGSYRRAGDLSSGDSLMPLYRKKPFGIRKHKCDYRVIQSRLEKAGLDWRERKYARVNHKVLSVESAGSCDVFDFEVDTYHNFALSAGVFVHNSQMSRLLTARSGTTPKTIPLPFASINRVSEAYDPQRFNNSYMYRVAANSDLTEWYGMKRPAPYNITYQIDLWARNLKDLDALGNQLALRQRADEIYLTVDHPVIPTHDLSGTTQLYALTLLRGINETSEKEPGRNQRVLRRSHTYEVAAWKDYVPEQYGVVETVITEIWDTDDDQPLETGTDLLDTVRVIGVLED